MTVPSESPQAPGSPEQDLRSLFPAYISEDTRAALAELCRAESSDPEEQRRFAEECLAYARDFGRRHPLVVRALFAGDELGGTVTQRRKSAQAKKRYAGRDVRRGEVWNGAGEHTFALGMLSEILARKMGLSDASVERVALAGAVHDWWKKHEILRMWDAEDTLKAHGTPVSRDTANLPEVVSAVRRAFDGAKEEDRAGLRKLGFAEDVIALAGANRLRDSAGPRTDEELIIFYLDHVLAGVRPVPMLERIRQAVGGNPSYAAYEASFRAQLGGRTSHEVLLEDGKGVEIQRRLAERLGYDGDPDMLHEYVVTLFTEAVRAGEADAV